jgi:biopolymer transport protein ExbB
VLGSLFLALTYVPAMASWALRDGEATPAPWLTALTARYQRVLTGVMKRPQPLLIAVHFRADDTEITTSELEREQLLAFDRERALLPLLMAATAQPESLTLESQGRRESQLTRRLRDSLNAVLTQLRFGQVLLASIGSTAPFIGLFGTVWGIYHALTAIGIAGQASIDKVAGPVGEALIMTAIGLAVAVPAVLGYNFLVRRNKVAMESVRRFGGELHTVLLGGKRAGQ